MIISLRINRTGWEYVSQIVSPCDKLLILPKTLFSNIASSRRIENYYRLRSCVREENCTNVTWIRFIATAPFECTGYREKIRRWQRGELPKIIIMNWNFVGFRHTSRSHCATPPRQSELKPRINYTKPNELNTIKASWGHFPSNGRQWKQYYLARCTINNDDFIGVLAQGRHRKWFHQLL